jgi:heterodisulfide reductase subunit B2
MSGYGYYPGCSMHSGGKAYGESLLTLFKLLDLPLQELDDWNCCGATSYMSIDESQAFTLSARNLSIATQAGHKEIVAPCAACYLVLRKTQDYVERYPEIGKQVQKSLAAANLPMPGALKVRHPLEVLFTDVTPERIKSKVVRRWRGGPVACYYGCQVVRPYGEADRMHDPTRMDELLQAVGVPTVEYALKTKCCSGSLTGTIPDVGVRLNYILLKEARRKKADAIATACPLCQYNLDAYQGEIRSSADETLDMPVLYFTQILAWALGGDLGALGLKRSISGQRLIKQWFSSSPQDVETYV